jgi:hypothetical protein
MCPMLDVRALIVRHFTLVGPGAVAPSLQHAAVAKFLRAFKKGPFGELCTHDLTSEAYSDRLILSDVFCRMRKMMSQRRRTAAQKKKDALRRKDTKKRTVPKPRKSRKAIMAELAQKRAAAAKGTDDEAPATPEKTKRPRPNGPLSLQRGEKKQKAAATSASSSSSSEAATDDAPKLPTKKVLPKAVHCSSTDKEDATKEPAVGEEQPAQRVLRSSPKKGAPVCILQLAYCFLHACVLCLTRLHNAHVLLCAGWGCAWSCKGDPGRGHAEGSR